MGKLIGQIVTGKRIHVIGKYFPPWSDNLRRSHSIKTWPAANLKNHVTILHTDSFQQFAWIDQEPQERIIMHKLDKAK